MLEITFHRLEKGSRWDARRGKSHVDGTFMGGPGDALPHDLVGLVIEEHLDVHGFWWAVDRGATFRSMRKKPTKPGRAVVKEHVDDLRAAEEAVHAVEWAWRRGEPSPVADELDRLAAEWKALPVGGSMVRTYVSPAAPRARGPRRSSPHPTPAPVRSAGRFRSRS